MLQPLFDDILSKRSADLLNKSTQYPRNNPIASDISPCPRETALSILHWQDRPPFDEKLLARFEVGNDQENLAIAKMLRYGLKIVEQQQNFELRDAKKRLILRGKIDGKIQVDGKRIPFDYKTVNPMAFERLNTVEDLLDNRFFSKYPKQLWAYEYMNDIETGFVWMDNLLGQWKFVEIPMDWNRMETILKQCEAAVEAVEQVRGGAPEAKALPPFHQDPTVCMGCWARGRVCTPPFFSGEGMKLINAPEIEEKLRRRAELDANASEYDRLDKEVKAVLKEAMKPMDVFVFGEFVVKAEEKKRNMKAQPAKPATTQTYLGFEIERMNGERA